MYWPFKNFSVTLFVAFLVGITMGCAPNLGNQQKQLYIQKGTPPTNTSVTGVSEKNLKCSKNFSDSKTIESSVAALKDKNVKDSPDISATAACVAIHFSDLPALSPSELVGLQKNLQSLHQKRPQDAGYSVALGKVASNIFKMISPLCAKDSVGGSGIEGAYNMINDSINVLRSQALKYYIRALEQGLPFEKRGLTYGQIANDPKYASIVSAFKYSIERSETLATSLDVLTILNHDAIAGHRGLGTIPAIETEILSRAKSLADFGKNYREEARAIADGFLTQNKASTHFFVSSLLQNFKGAEENRKRLKQLLEEEVIVSAAANNQPATEAATPTIPAPSTQGNRPPTSAPTSAVPANTSTAATDSPAAARSYFSFLANQVTKILPVAQLKAIRDTVASCQN